MARLHTTDTQAWAGRARADRRYGPLPTVGVAAF